MLGYSAGMTMQETIAVLLGWAVQLSSYPMPDQPPRVEYRPQSFFIEEVCRSPRCRTLGWYDHKGTIYIDDRLRGRNDKFSNSLLVHEFVHYLQHQHENYDPANCDGHVRREREAYAIQREYVARAYGEAAFIRMVLPPCPAAVEGNAAAADK